MQRTDQYLLWATLALLLWGLFSTLGVMDLRGEEPRRALVALEMIYRGEYLRPTVHGWSYYNKPPVFNWLVAGCYLLFGSFDNWVLRLPSTLAFLLTGLINYFIVRRWVNERVALLSSIFFLTTGHLLYFATVLSGEIDLLYGLIVYLQVIAIFVAFERRRYFNMFLLSYVLMGVGFLIKGLTSLPFQAFTLLAAAAWYRQWRVLFGWRHLLSMVIGFGTIALYFYRYSFEDDAWLFLFRLLKEATEKSASESKVSAVGLNLLTFPLQLIADLLPWILAAGLLFTRRGRKSLLENPLITFSLLFIASNIWLYWTAPGTHSRYHYMFFPFFTLLSAWAVERLSRIRLRTVLILALVLAAGRVAYNYTVLPYQMRTMQRSAQYRIIVRETLRISGDQPVYWTGLESSLPVTPAIGPWQLLDTEVIIPPIMPYVIPFYISRANGYIFEYHPAPRSGNLYLAEERFIRRYEVEVLRRFSGWEGKKVVLCRMP